MDRTAFFMEDSAVRAPLTHHPKVDRLSGGRLLESAGYRVLRPTGTTDYLLLVTRSGCGRIGSPDRDDLSAPTGTATVIRPGTPHDYGVESSLQRWELDFCHFHPRPEWHALLDWPEVRPGIGQLPIGTEVDRRTRETWSAVAYFTRSQQARADLFGMNALEEILLWYDTQNQYSKPLDTRILRVLEHVDRTLTAPHPVAELAEVAHLSVSRFAHLFRTQLGMSPSAYVERQRMAEARLLLEHSSRSVAEIARAVGFDDPLYFSSRFKHVVGASPRQYRRR